MRFIGVGDTIEIWASTGNDEPFMDSEAFGAAMEQLMSLEF